MENMKWNKLTTRPLDDEEKEYYKDSKIDFMWEGNEPEIGEEVLVYSSQYEGVTTDTWTDDFDYGVGFEYTDASVIYWMSFPEPPRIVSTQKEETKTEEIDKETIKLIEELCQKEVERTRLPLVLDKDSISVEDEVLYFRQKMTLDLEGFDEVFVDNQNHLKFKDGKWKLEYDKGEFYGYELHIRRNGYSYATNLRLNNRLTKENLVKKLSSDKFKEIFDKCKELDKEPYEIRDNLKFFINEG